MPWRFEPRSKGYGLGERERRGEREKLARAAWRAPPFELVRAVEQSKSKGIIDAWRGQRP